MPEISENSHKISAAQLFCILLLMRVSSELAYPSKGGFGGSGLAAALTAEAVRFVIALPVLIYACKGGGFYAAVWRKNRFLGWVAAVGAALLLAGFVVRTAVYASGFVRRNMLLKTPQLLIALLMAAFAVYAAVKALPPKYRAVVHLYYYEGYDQGEIGEILHISRTAVQTRMSRARAMLKMELNGDDGEEIPAYDGAGKHG